MRLQDDIDFTTLTWVKGELDETLKQARQALEAYVEDPTDVSQMRFCATYLHQVQGTLRMVELYGAAMVTEEMERLADALMHDGIGNRDDAYTVLMRGIVQLPDYLERLQSGHKDIPIVLLPLLNDLRAARGEKGLSESVLFSPDLGRSLPGSAKGPERAVDAPVLGRLAEQLRVQFQLSLLKWFKNEDPATHVARLAAVCDKLVTLLAQEDARRLFWISAGLLTALRERAFDPPVPLKQAFGKVEREIKRLVDQGEAAFRVEPPRELTRTLLYFAAHAPTQHGRIAELRQTFDLDRLLPTEEEIRHAQGSISGHNRALLDTVSAAIKEDLLRVKDALDLHLRTQSEDFAALSAQAEILGRVADTLGMLGLGVPRGVVLEQRQAVEEVSQGKRPADESTLLDIAGALLYVESSLDDQVQHLGSGGGIRDAAQADSRKVLDALVKEAQANFAQAKQCFVAFVESSWDHTQLQDVPRLLGEVGGALRILELDEPPRYLMAISRFTEVELLTRRRVPNGQQLDTLADALASLEYYLEALREHRAGREKILDVARQRLEALGYWPIPDRAVEGVADGVPVAARDAEIESVVEAPAPPPPSTEPAISRSVDDTAPVEPDADAATSEPDAAVESVADAVPTPEPSEPRAAEPPAPAPAAAPAPAIAEGFELAGEDIDEEIREVFIEEVQEEINNLGDLYPVWKANPESAEHLKPIRRVFHTLKGSGRLVGALTLGEFSWKIENMLNRVLDQSIRPDAGVVAIIGAAHEALPGLLEALKGEGRITSNLEGIKQAADRIAAGELMSAAQVREAARFAEPAPAAEPEPVAAEVPAVEEAQVDSSAEAPQALEDAEQAAEALPAEAGSDALEDALQELGQELEGELELEAVAEAGDEPAEADPLDLEAAADEPLDVSELVDEDTLAALDGESEAAAGGLDELSEALERELAGVEFEPDETPSLDADEAVELEAVELVGDDELLEALESVPAEAEAEAEAEADADADAAEQDGSVFAIDAVLFDILKAEVAGHLETVDQYIAESASQPQLVSDPLLRAVHTMSGAFAMTEVPHITDVVSPLEGYIKRLIAQRAAPSTEGISLIAESADAIRELMRSLEREPPFAPAFGRLAEQLVALRDTLPEPSGPLLPLHTEAEEEDAAAPESIALEREEIIDSPAAAEEFEVPGFETPAPEESEVPADALAEAVADGLELSELAVDETAADLPATASFEDAASLESLVAAADDADAEPETLSFEDLEQAAEAMEGAPAGALAEDDSAFEIVEEDFEDAPSAADAPADTEQEGAARAEDDAALVALLLSEEPGASEAVEIEVADLGEMDEAAIEAALAGGPFDAGQIESIAVETDAAAAPEALASDVEAGSEAVEETESAPIDPADAGLVEDEALEVEAIELGAGDELTLQDDVSSSEAAEVPAEAIEAETVEVAEVEAESVELDVRTEAEEALEVEISDEPSSQDGAESVETAVEAEIVEQDLPVSDESDLEPAAEAPAVEAPAVETEQELEAEADQVTEAEAEVEVDLAESDAAPAAAAEETDTRAAAAAASGLAAALANADPDPDGPLQLPDMDEELLDIFLEEGVDILDHSDGLLARLRDNPTDRELVVGLQRDLHTLKGGARMAGLVPIGDLGHSAESLLEAVADGRRDLGGLGMEVLERVFDRLHGLVTRVGERKALAMPVTLLGYVEALARGEQLDFAPAEAESEAPEASAADAAPSPTPTAAKPAELAGVAKLTALDTALDEDETLSRAPQEQIRIRADLLDRLVNYAGEVAIYRARLEQQVGAFRGGLVEMEATTNRLREQLRRLEIETEAQIIARYQREQDEGEAANFDPLELDRFSTLQQLSRALSESAADLTNLQGTLEDLTRQYETLLLQQSRVSSELQEGLMRTRMVPFDALVPRLRRILRQTASELGKKAQLKVEGAQGEMDRNVLDRMTAPLEHMLRNALAHGLEGPEDREAAGKPAEGTVRINVSREASEVVIRVSDDGRGMDRDAIRRKAIERGLLDPDAQLSDRELFGFVLESGFSTAQSVSKIAGRGVGMDVVHSEIKQLGGSLYIESEFGKGSEFVVRLPFTLAVTQAVFVKLGETSYAIPITSVQGVARIAPDVLQAKLAEGDASFEYAGERYAIHDLGLLLGHGQVKATESLQVPLLLARSGDLRAAISIDQVIGSREIVVKPTGPQVNSIPGIFGATVMGDGSVVIILDVAPLVRRAAALHALGEAPTQAAPVEQRAIPLVMVVDDSITMRKVSSRVLERAGYEVLTAKDGVDAIEKMQERVPDAMLLDIEMPRMDGYELATHMRNDVRMRGVPIIMITSRTGEKHRQRAFEIGVDRYLGKPYQEAELMRNVQELLKVGRGGAG